MTSELRQREPRIHDPGFLKWLRKKPCVVCCWPKSQAAHLRAGNLKYGKEYPGTRRKPDDKWATPLCQTCHYWQTYSKSGEVEWWLSKGFRDPFKLAMQYHEQYRKETSAPVMEVQRYRKKAKKVRRADQPKRQIQNRVHPWPKRSFPKKRATKQ